MRQRSIMLAHQDTAGLSNGANCNLADSTIANEHKWPAKADGPQADFRNIGANRWIEETLLGLWR